jgi:hypothetical protein
MSGTSKFVVGFTLFYALCCFVAVIRCRRELRTAQAAAPAQHSDHAVSDR